MEHKKIRQFTIDGDTVTVSQIYDDELGVYRNDYPDFEKNPRVTPTGKPWTNVFKEDCAFATSEYGDCGSCDYFKCENKGDLIGVCENKEMMISYTSEDYKYERKEA